MPKNRIPGEEDIQDDERFNRIDDDIEYDEDEEYIYDEEEDELEEDQDELGNEDDEFTDEDIERLLKVSDKRLKAMGIDDPKQWKNYQRALTKKTNEFKSREAEYQKKLEELGKAQPVPQSKPDEPEEKPLVKPTPPSLPKRPANFKWEDVVIEGTASQQYMQDKDEYELKRMEYDAKLEEYNSYILERTQNEVRKEREANKKRAEAEAIKSKMIAEFRANGLDAEEALSLYNKVATGQIFEPKNLVALEKAANGKGKKYDKRDKFDKTRRRRKGAFPPGIGSRGSSDTPIKNEFSKSDDHSNLYRTKK